MMTYYRGRYGGGNDYYRSLAKRHEHVGSDHDESLLVVFGLVSWAIVRMQYEWKLTPIIGSVTRGWMVLLTLLLIGSLGRGQNETRCSQVDSGSHWVIGDSRDMLHDRDRWYFCEIPY